MALIKCPECDKEISDKARSCPNCGLPLEEKQSLYNESDTVVKDVPQNDMPVKNKKELSGKQLVAFNLEMEKRKRNTGIAYLLWLVLGGIGIHKFYLRNRVQGFIQLVSGIILIICFIGFKLSGERDLTGPFVVFGLLPFLVYIVFILIDLFTIPERVKDANKAIESEILKEIYIRS